MSVPLYSWIHVHAFWAHPPPHSSPRPHSYFLPGDLSARSVASPAVEARAPTTIMVLPGVSHYERMPTRTKIQFFWISMLTMGFAYQFLKMTVLRVQPKREEQMYMHIRKVYGDNIPEELLQRAKRQREAQDALTLTNMLRTPTPGQTSNALQNDLDPRALIELKSWNGH